MFTDSSQLNYDGVGLSALSFGAGLGPARTEGVHLPP